MSLMIQVESHRLRATLRGIRGEMGKNMRTLVKDAAKIAVRKAIEFTAPGESEMSGKEAKARGEMAIAQDAMGGARGSLGKTKRSGIFFVANEGLLRKWHANSPGGEVERLFARKDGTVWATEKRFYRPGASIAEMDSHHAKYWRNGRMTSAGTRDRTIGRTKFVDRMVVGKGAFRAWLKNRQKRVGGLAAGFMPAVTGLRIGRIPAWITRHARRSGTYLTQDSASSFAVVVTNRVGYGAGARLPRVVIPAIRAARLGMLAQGKHIKQKSIERARAKAILS